MFIWAAIVSYSRIYLAKHYPLDVICGAALGIALAICVYLIWKFALYKYEMYRRQRA
jgi:undecaprenyl-diphosphatase